MTVSTCEAVFDGEVFRPKEPIHLPAGLEVQIIIHELEQTQSAHPSFLQTARSLNLEGPPDWSTNLETYLYTGDKRNDA